MTCSISQYPTGLSLAIQLKSIAQGAFLLEHVSFLWTVFVQCWPKQVYYYSMAAMSGPEISPESPVTANPYGIPGWANLGSRGFWFALSQTCLSLTALVCPTWTLLLWISNFSSHWLRMSMHNFLHAAFSEWNKFGTSVNVGRTVKPWFFGGSLPVFASLLFSVKLDPAVWLTEPQNNEEALHLNLKQDFGGRVVVVGELLAAAMSLLVCKSWHLDCVKATVSNVNGGWKRKSWGRSCDKRRWWGGERSTTEEGVKYTAVGLRDMGGLVWGHSHTLKWTSES